jgi:hypothetical protein
MHINVFEKCEASRDKAKYLAQLNRIAHKLTLKKVHHHHHQIAITSSHMHMMRFFYESTSQNLIII